MLANIFIGYWPKFVAALWFCVFNLIMVYRYTGSKRFIPERAVVGFIVSPAFLSIIGELFTVTIYNYLVDNNYFTDEKNVIYVIVCFTMDAAIVWAGGALFTACTGLWHFRGACIYMIYVCVERLSLVVAIDYVGFMVLFFGFQALLFLLLRKDLPYLFTGTSIKWNNLFIYLMGIFYILDALYGAYFIFPELGTNQFNVENLMWIDFIALIACGFFCGYMKMSIAQAKDYDKKIDYFQKLQSSQEDIIITLAEISEAKSGETGQHVRRVAEYSKLLASKLGLTFLEVETIKIAAMMHDLGKLMISHDIIEKPDKLTTEEYEIVKNHSKYGWEILSKSKGEIIKMARVIALQHHEYWDGNGYPNGLKGDQISIYAQIVSVADVFDALTSDRSYKDAWSNEDALTEIMSQKGKMFAPHVVDVFVSCFDEIMEIKNTYVDE